MARRVMGPVDVAVLGFLDPDPGPALAEAVGEAIASDAVRVLDALWIRKAADGTVTIVDVDDQGEAENLLGFDIVAPGLLGEEDAADIAASLPDGTAAAVIVWENVWASRVSEAVIAAGGMHLGHDRIPGDVMEDLLDILGDAPTSDR